MFSNLNFQIFEPQNLEKDHFSELVTYWTWIPFKDQLAICLTSGTFFCHFSISGTLKSKPTLCISDIYGKFSFLKMRPLKHFLSF